MPGDGNAGRTAISRAGALADALSRFGDSDSEIARARACYDSLHALALDHAGSADIRDRLICGALRLAACHARRKDIAAIEAVRTRLEDYASGHPDDPGMRRGYCELSITLCLEYTRQGKNAEADATFEEIRTIAARHPRDRPLRSTLAKAIANRIAARCNEGRTDAARHLHRSLCALAEVPNSHADTRLHRANGSFNLATHLARSGATRHARYIYDDLGHFIAGHGSAPELEEVLADAGFALVTIFGDAGKLSLAEKIYLGLRRRAACAGNAEEVITGKTALAAFNLMTDFCRQASIASARHVYDDILALSAACPDDAGIARLHAKACVNLLLTVEAHGDGMHAELLSRELAQLLTLWPEDGEIRETASTLLPPLA